jgi:hypothetical protein
VNPKSILNPIAGVVVPTDEETAEEAVRPLAGMSADERLTWLSALVDEAIALAGDRPQLHYDDFEPLWPRWKDPLIGGRVR